MHLKWYAEFQRFFTLEAPGKETLLLGIQSGDVVTEVYFSYESTNGRIVVN